jgi:pimeloyl-ACP methyl ester carboxylesterase
MIYWSRKTESAVQERYRRILGAWPTPHTEHRIPTSQGETFVITTGSRDAPSVVFLPGAMATSAMWLGTIDAVADRFRAIAVDLIGDAGFSAPSRPSMRTDAHARWIDDVLDALAVESAHLVGASFGGWIALDYAIRRQARVRALALLAPAGIGRIRPGFMIKTAPLLLLGPWGHQRALNINMGFAEDDIRLGNSAFLELFRTVQSDFVARMRPIPVFSDAALRTLSVPVLTVVGGRDVVLDSYETQRRVEATMPNGQVLMLPDAGHGLIDTTQMVREFLLSTSGLPKFTSWSATPAQPSR